jgi:radical SAM superfamily enzyme YgiQ (UPF0313 family)
VGNVKILLIRPYQKIGLSEGDYVTRKNYIFPPLGLQTLAGLTPSGIEIKIVDEYIEKINFDEECDLVGMTLYNRTEVNHAKNIYNRFKERGVPVISGGPQISMGTRMADSVMLWEAEGVWHKVLKDLRSGGLKRIYKSKSLPDLKRCKNAPRRDLTKNRRYFFHSVETSRGCTNRCSFCTIPYLSRYSFRTFPVERTLKEIEQCLEYPARIKRYIFFSDNNITSRPEHKSELFKKLMPYNIMWHSFSDISIAKKPRLLRLFAESGCVSLHIGIESLNQKSLDFINKGVVRVDELKKSIKAIQDYGIRVNAMFIIGLYYDKAGVSRDVFRFSRDCNLNAVSVSKLGINRNDDIFRKLEAVGALMKDADGEFHSGAKHMSKEEIAAEYDWLKEHLRKNEIYNVIRNSYKSRRIIINPRIGIRNALNLLSGYASLIL